MISFSVNRQVDLSEVDLMPREGNSHWLGREWLSTIYLQCVDGRKGPKPVIPNLDAYAFACEEHRLLKDTKVNVPIITEEELEKGSKGIMLEQLNKYATEKSSGIDLSFEEQEEYDQIFESFKDTRAYIYLEKGIDLAELILQAYSMVPTAIKTLRSIYKEFETPSGSFEQTVQVLLHGENWHEDMQNLASTPILTEEQ